MSHVTLMAYEEIFNIRGIILYAFRSYDIYNISPTNYFVCVFTCLNWYELLIIKYINLKIGT